MRSVKGFTLIELMVALAILAIALTLGFASFGGSLARSRADSDVNELLHVLSWARLQAINHSETVSVDTLANSDWTQAISITRDGEVIRSLPGLANGAVVEVTGDISGLTFDGLGGLSSSNTALDFTYTRGDQSRSVILCPTGRAQLGDEC